MSLDEPRRPLTPPPAPHAPSRARLVLLRLVLVRLAVVAGSFVLCAAVALLASAATSDAEALRPVGWLAMAGLLAGLGALALRDRRHAERRRRFEEWWTHVSQRRGFAPPEDLDT